MFGRSNLGLITAIVGADQLRAMHAPPALLLPMLTIMSAWLDFLIASGSAKWTAMAPVAKVQNLKDGREFESLSLRQTVNYDVLGGTCERCPTAGWAALGIVPRLCSLLFG